MNTKNFYSTIALVLFFVSANGWASLSVHPFSLSDTIVSGTSGTTLLHITNVGPSGTLGYTVTENIDWLSAYPTSGDISLNQTITVTISIDATLLTAGTYAETLTVTDPHHGPIAIPFLLLVENVTGVDDEIQNSPLTFSLEQNYPNPFNPTTNVRFVMSNSSLVSLKIYNVLGYEVATLLNNNVMQKGEHEIVWNASNVPSGVYFYRLKVESLSEKKEHYTAIKQMTLIK